MRTNKTKKLPENKKVCQGLPFVFFLTVNTSRDRKMSARRSRSNHKTPLENTKSMHNVTWRRRITHWCTGSRAGSWSSCKNDIISFRVPDHWANCWLQTHKYMRKNSDMGRDKDTPISKKERSYKKPQNNPLVNYQSRNHGWRQTMYLKNKYNHSYIKTWKVQLVNPCYHMYGLLFTNQNILISHIYHKTIPKWHVPDIL